MIEVLDGLYVQGLGKGVELIDGMYKIGNGTSPSYIDVILSGVSPLTLEKAISLNYLKLFGGTEQSGTPTPDTPMDIVCNNGVVKAFKTLNISTYDTSASNAGVDITFDGATDRRKWDTLNDSGTGTNHYENGFVSIYMDEIGNRYYAKALVNGVAYNGSVYNAEKQIDSWYFNIAKNINIYCPTINTDGTTETVWVHSNNLWNPNGVDYGWITTSGEFSVDGVSRMVEVEQGETYTYKSYSSTNSFFNCIALYDANKNFIANTRRIITTGDTKTNTVTITDANVKYLACSYYISGGQREPDWQMIVEGTGDIPYEPYFNGGTATAERLLKVGDYKDEQEVISGSITRNVGVKVLNGTENWDSISGAFATVLADIPMPGQFVDTTISNTHFNGVIASTAATTMPDLTSKISNSNALGNKYALFIKYNAMATVANFKQYLADQYNAGTPVIVVYPLATATTESVTEQPLTVQAGTNIVEITQASIDNLAMEVGYRQKV